MPPSKLTMWCFVGLFCTLAASGVRGDEAFSASQAEMRIIQEVFRRQRGHRHLARPSNTTRGVVAVHFGVGLIQILKFDEKNQIIRLLLWKRYKWEDHTLAWDPADYDGLDSIGLPAHLVWKPDIVLYSHVGSRSVEQHHEMVVLSSDGTVFWIPAVVYDSTCDVDMTYFPFDRQTCVLKFGSWVHSSNFLDMEFFQGLKELDLTSYIKSSEWKIVGNKAKKHYVEYPCCANVTFCDITFQIVLERKSGFYTAVLLLPALLLSLLVLVIFWIPPQRPDRTTLGMNIFGSFVILLLVILETSPPSAAISLGSYCCISIILVTVATSFSSVIVNLATYRRPMPKVLKRIFVEILAKRMCGPVMCGQSDYPEVLESCARPLQNSAQIPATTTTFQDPKYADLSLDSNRKTESSISPNERARDVTRQWGNYNRDWLLMTKVLDRFMFLICFVLVFLCIVGIFPRPHAHGPVEEGSSSWS